MPCRRKWIKDFVVSFTFCYNLTFNCVLVSESGSEAVTDRRKKLLEQYGLDPDEFLSEPSTNVGSLLSL